MKGERRRERIYNTDGVRNSLSASRVPEIKKGRLSRRHVCFPSSETRIRRSFCRFKSLRPRPPVAASAPRKSIEIVCPRPLSCFQNTERRRRIASVLQPPVPPPSAGYLDGTQCRYRYAIRRAWEARN